MTTPRLLILTGAITSLIAASAQAVDTPYIGVNFVGRNDGADALNATDTAGLFPQQNYNNNLFSGNGGFSTSAPQTLNDASGVATPVTLVVTANDSWNSGSGHASPDSTLLNGLVKNFGTGSTDTFTLANVPSGTYDLVFYTTENGGPATFNASLAGSTTTAFNGVQESDGGNPINKANPVTYVLDTASTPGNYIEFAGVSPDANGTFALSFSHTVNSDGAGIAGFQLASAVPEPSTWVAAGGLLLLAAGDFRRRLKA